MNKGISVLLSIALLVSACNIIPQQESNTMPEDEVTSPLPATSTAVPQIQLPEVDEVVFTIPNPQPFSGREGETRPNWLGWGAETFVVAPDGSCWIDDTAVTPNRLLHYSPQGELLREISLEGLVVYPYDLAVTQGNVWLLDISSQPPKIVQLDMEGTFQTNLDFLNMIGKQGGALALGMGYSLSVGEKGELLLQMIDRYYEIVDTSGGVTGRPLNALSYYGHTYRTGLYNEAAHWLPVIVDGMVLDIPSDFFVESPFLGFNPDGSLAIAGTVEDADHQIDRQVRYYSASGQLLGMARQRPQTFYKDWNHHLALGPDGSVYQLASNPDHSVQILRLGSSEQLPPLAKPAPTPTPLTALQPSEPAATDEEQARSALLAFFSDLSSGKYKEAAARYGGEKIEYAREPMSGETMGEYWEYSCSTVLWCLPVISDITDIEQVGEDEFIFTVVFMQPDGARFELGACCGGGPAAFPPVWQFAYPVKKILGTWKVMRGPIFTP